MKKMLAALLAALMMLALAACGGGNGGKTVDVQKLADDLKDIAVIESQPKMEGRNMHMLIAPLPASMAAKKKKANDKKDEGKDEGNA